MAYSLEKQRQMLDIALSEVECTLGSGIESEEDEKWYKDTKKYLNTLIDRIDNKIKKKK